VDADERHALDITRCGYSLTSCQQRFQRLQFMAWNKLQRRVGLRTLDQCGTPDVRLRIGYV